MGGGLDGYCRIQNSAHMGLDRQNRSAVLMLCILELDLMFFAALHGALWWTFPGYELLE
jgi:hypothetical protein